jgi:glycosyltransferase involved in cell wall biosynthesis
MSPSFSIIICTRNRAKSLSVTLQSIGKATVPQGWQVELLVVDNGSTDSTKEISLSTRLNNMPIRYVSEPRKGKGYAYNTGMAEARGRIFLFTDDDVLVPTDWIEGMGRPILEGDADAVQGGIKIAPHLDRPWLTGTLRVWVASVEDPERRPPGLVGANMAFGHQALDVTDGFDLRLGPGAAGYFDDTVFGWALERAGQKILYRPAVAVEHHFSPDRLTLRSYISSAERMAVSHAIVKQDLDPAGFRPSVIDLLKQLPGLGYRCVTQIARFLINRQPDPGFVNRYYYFCLWRAMRKV